MLLDVGIWLLIGFAVAGVLHVLLSAKSIARFLEGEGFRPTLNAVLFGAPIPLCSCSVLPVAKALRDGGAGRGPTAGFLISAPETGADAIALSWVLMGPVWAIVRPVAAIVTALTAGILQPKDVTKNIPQQIVIRKEKTDKCDSCDQCHCESNEKTPLSVREKVTEAIYYAFIDQPTELARYLLPGILMGGVITLLFPPASLTSHSNGFPMYAAAVLIGLPLFICSSASTPFAASLLVAGVAPGPILAFMLVGPATNITSFAAVRKLLGTKGLTIQLTVIVTVAVLSGLGLDAVQNRFSIIPVPKAMSLAAETPQIWHTVGAATLLLILFIGLYRDIVQKKR